MTESEFIESIDCKFPYGDTARSRQLMELGASISANSAFMVLHEICRPPRSKAINPEMLQVLLTAWCASFSHPLVHAVLPAAKAMVCGEAIPVEQALVAMRAVAPHKNQFNALAIPYFACNDASGVADALHEEITRGWSAPN